ncbi:hypothetical protein GC170_18645 [bacterium]|nr:hypothetical protein [bacterium]
MRNLRYFLAIPILLYMVVASYFEDSKYERNRAPKENVRQASSIATMWAKGFSASNVPSMPPSAGLTLIRKTLESKADEEVKTEARKIEKQLNRYPAYVQFADRISAFRDDFDRMRAVVVHGLKQPKPANQKIFTNFVPGCLIVTARQHDSLKPDPEADVLMFEPDMIEALGYNAAQSPTELKTLVVLEFIRAEDGEYHVVEDVKKGIKAKNFEGIKLPAYAHGCRAYVIDYATGKVTLVREWYEEDPESRKLSLLGQSRTSEPDGYAKLRKQVTDWIRKMSSPPQPDPKSPVS